MEGSNKVERIVDRDKAVARVDEASIRMACRAEVPVWAVKALVTNTIDVLIAVSRVQ